MCFPVIRSHREVTCGEMGIFRSCLGVLSTLNLQINRLKYIFPIRKML